ncbi:MAG: FRG domain-containing protein [Bryobacterales bacterium]|nr:FRG domain-containing protein [Bryobacterales bacterium]
MVQVEVENIPSFLDAARKLCPGSGRAEYWFRGHARADWPLVPAIHREYDSVGERNLVHRFRLAARTRYAHCPDLRDVAAWLCLMQHWGLPTRLLDWTASPLTALYFAVVHDPKPGPAAAWVLAPGELNKSSGPKLDEIFQLTGREAMKLLEPAFGRGQANEEVVAAVGQEIDVRMTVQQGAFTLHGSSVPLESRAGAENYLAKFVIPEKSKTTFAEELRFLAVRRSTLFPDLANLASDLANDWRLKPPKPVHENPAGPPGKEPRSD